MDFTAEVAELEAAYRANRVANASIATEVRQKYRTIIADEIRQRKKEADIEFARHLALVKARSGMPLQVIQDHILHTKTWSRWVYWRDLAEIEPERVSVANAREANRREKAGWRWEEAETPFGYALVLTRDAKGRAISEEVWITDIRELPKGRLDAWPTTGEGGHRAIWEGHWDGDGNAMRRYVTDLANENRGEIGK